MQTYILLTCDPGHEKETITHLKSIEEIVEVNGIWGEYDIFVKVSHNTPVGLDKVVAIIRNMENITGTFSMPVLFGQGGSIDE